MLPGSDIHSDSDSSEGPSHFRSRAQDNPRALPRRFAEKNVSHDDSSPVLDCRRPRKTPTEVRANAPATDVTRESGKTESTLPQRYGAEPSVYEDPSKPVRIRPYDDEYSNYDSLFKRHETRNPAWLNPDSDRDLGLATTGTRRPPVVSPYDLPSNPFPDPYDKSRRYTSATVDRRREDDVGDKPSQSAQRYSNFREPTNAGRKLAKDAYPSTIYTEPRAAVTPLLPSQKDPELRRILQRLEAWTVTYDNPFSDSESDSESDNEEKKEDTIPSTKKATLSPESVFAQATVSKQHIAQDDIQILVERLNRRRRIGEKVMDYRPEEWTVMTALVNQKVATEEDERFEWLLDQLDYTKIRERRNAKSSALLCLKRIPRVDADLDELLRERAYKRSSTGWKRSRDPPPPLYAPKPHAKQPALKDLDRETASDERDALYASDYSDFTREAMLSEEALKAGVKAGWRASRNTKQEGARFDSDIEEYDFVGRDEANPFRIREKRNTGRDSQHWRDRVTPYKLAPTRKYTSPPNSKPRNQLRPIRDDDFLPRDIARNKPPTFDSRKQDETTLARASQDGAATQDPAQSQLPKQQFSATVESEFPDSPNADKPANLLASADTAAKDPVTTENESPRAEIPADKPVTFIPPTTDVRPTSTSLQNETDRWDNATLSSTNNAKKKRAVIVSPEPTLDGTADAADGIANALPKNSNDLEQHLSYVSGRDPRPYLNSNLRQRTTAGVRTRAARDIELGNIFPLHVPAICPSPGQQDSNRDAPCDLDPPRDLQHAQGDDNRGPPRNRDRDNQSPPRRKPVGYGVSLSYAFAGVGFIAACLQSIAVYKRHKEAQDPLYMPPTTDDTDFFEILSNACWLAVGLLFSFQLTVKHGSEHKDYARWVWVWCLTTLSLASCFVSVSLYLVSSALCQGISGAGSALQMLVYFLTIRILEKGEIETSLDEFRRLDDDLYRHELWCRFRREELHREIMDLVQQRDKILTAKESDDATSQDNRSSYRDRDSALGSSVAGDPKLPEDEEDVTVAAAGNEYLHP